MRGLPYRGPYAQNRGLYGVAIKPRMSDQITAILRRSDFHPVTIGAQVQGQCDTGMQVADQTGAGNEKRGDGAFLVFRPVSARRAKLPDN